MSSKHEHLPPIGFVRLSKILEVYPISKSHWWAGVKAGRLPPPVRLGPRTTVWKVEDIRELLEEAGNKIH